MINYLSHYHSPERMVVAGVGVDHQELVEVAQVTNDIRLHIYPQFNALKFLLQYFTNNCRVLIFIHRNILSIVNQHGLKINPRRVLTTRSHNILEAVSIQRKIFLAQA